MFSILSDPGWEWQEVVSLTQDSWHHSAMVNWSRNPPRMAAKPRYGHLAGLSILSSVPVVIGTATNTACICCLGNWKLFFKPTMITLKKAN